MLFSESHNFKSYEVQKKLCDPGHQVCPTQTCSRKKQGKKLFISDLPCALSCAGYEGAKGREDSTWSSISAGLCPLGKKVAVAEGGSQQGVIFGRVMKITRVEAPFSEPWASFLLRGGVVSLSLSSPITHSHLSFFTSFLPSKRIRGVRFSGG